MADFPGDLIPSYLSAYLMAPLPHLHERVVIDPSKPSAVRVFGKSMHIVAAGWAMAAGWLWMQQHNLHVLPSMRTVDTMLTAVLPALLLVVVGWLFARYVGRAPYRELELREWRHALGWCVVPNALLLVTVWIIGQQTT